MFVLRGQINDLGITMQDTSTAVAREFEYSSPSDLTNGDRISVCHIVAGDGWAGAEVQVLGLLKCLRRNPAITLHVVSLSDGRLAAEVKGCGIDCYVVHQEEKTFPRVVRECSEFVKIRNVDIIHTHKYKGNIIGLLAARRAAIPYVIRTAHGCTEPYSLFKKPKHWLALTADHLCTRYLVDHVIAVSSEMLDYHRGCVDRHKITVIRNGVDQELAASHLSPNEAKKKLGLSAQRFVIGTVGRLEAVKRNDLFLEVARRVADRVPSASFVIVGSGSKESSLRARISELDLQRDVLLLGQRQDVYDVMRAMDVLLICSDHEGLPTVLLEAMALGVPVVSRAVGGIPEVLRHDSNGIMVSSADPGELADACVFLWASEQVRRRLVEAGSFTAQSLSVEKMSDNVVRLYRSVMTREAGKTGSRIRCDRVALH